MTQDEMNTDMEDAKSYLSCTRLTVDRCRHESVTTSSLWIMDGANQIGSATRLTPSEGYERHGTPMRWRCSTIHSGQCANGVYVSTLLDAIGHIMRCTKES